MPLEFYRTDDEKIPLIKENKHTKKSSAGTTLFCMLIKVNS